MKETVEKPSFSAKQNMKIEYQPSSSDISEEINPKKAQKRGRKRQQDDDYFKKSNEKIKAIKEILEKCKGTKVKEGHPDWLSTKERERLRNKVSAQQSRM